MTVFINPGPDLAAMTYYIACNSLFNFSSDKELVSAGEKEINIIRDFGDNLIEQNHIQATTGDNMLSDYRRSQVAWFNPHDAQHYWLIKRLSDNIAYFNALHWNFDLTGFTESCQYTTYNAEQLGHYNWHLDTSNRWDMPPRKLSVVIQLSDPSEYEGGEFCLKTHETDIVLSKEKGTLFIFPSFILHKVNPVTKGLRRSLVCWISGPKFR